MNRITIALLLSSAAVLGAEKPNFAGHWELEKATSAFGKMQSPTSYTEVIEQKGAMVVITATTVEPSGTVKSRIRLTTNDIDTYNEVSGNPLRTRTRWEGDRLITVITGGQNLKMTELRYLSKDHKRQTVETYKGGEVSGEPQTRVIMVLK